MKQIADLINDRTGLDLTGDDVRLLAKLAATLIVAALCDRYLGTSVIRERAEG
jgi:hypothetical protein